MREGPGSGFGRDRRGHRDQVGTTAGHRSVGAGALIGVGLMAGLDEIVFHQLLGWHHLYDRGSLAAGLTADGLLHLVEVVLYAAGVVLLFRLVLRRMVMWSHVGAGLLLGAGGFQLFDGTVNHKVLRLHQIRYGVELWPYDVAWDVAAIVLLGLGAALLRRTAAQSTVSPSDRGSGPTSD
jgi:uncharacterized membrane protein